MPKPTFPKGSPLNRKLKKGEDSPQRRQEKFVALCEYYGLEPAHFREDDDSPWRLLAQKLMEQLVPGFRVNKSGNKLRHSFYSDDEIHTLLGFKDLTLGRKQSYRERVSQLAKQLNMTESQITHASGRAMKFRATPNASELIYDPSEDTVLPEYLSATPSADRHQKNRKRPK